MMRARRTPTKERGFSLLELTIAVTLLGAVVAVFGPVMTSSLRSGRVVQNESRAIDEIRVAVDRIDRELRSACVVTAPVENSGGSTLTFDTQADSSGTYTVTYSVDSEGNLVRTRDGVSQSVAEGLVVTSEEFTHTLNNTGTRAEIQVAMQARFEDENDPRLVSTVIAGRNTWSGCS